MSDGTQLLQSEKASVLETLADETHTTGVIDVKTPVVCLTMIVKNESKIIERCMESAKDFIDCVCITDTGSEDNTAEIIKNWCEKHEIPHKVFHDTFKGFGPSRAQSFRNTKSAFPEVDYCLLLDADMELEVLKFDKSELNRASYRLYQYGSNLVYPNTRIISTKHDWTLTTRTHEFWESPGLKDQGQIPYESMRINDHNDGGCKADKFVRDIRLLKLDIHEGIQVARNTFYLAQTYKDLQLNDKAIKRYKKRIEMGAWFDEIWYSHWMIGQCYFRIAQKALDKDKKNPDTIAEADAIRYLLKAFNMKPNRAEPIMELSTWYRNQGMNHLAYHFAKIAMTCDPKDELLFVMQSKHSWEPWFEICITAFYLDKKAEGLEACEKLLGEYKDDLPDNIKLQVMNNMKFYQK